LAPRLGFVFPGQGSQRPGMAEALKDLWAAWDEHLRVVEDGRPGLGGLIDEGPAEDLARTENAQPALLLVSAGWNSVLRVWGLAPIVVAGHSLGEYGALLSAAVVDFATAADLVLERSQLMSDAAAGEDGAMAAVLGLDRDAVERALDRAAESAGERAVWVANVNCPGQIVISGRRAALASASFALTVAGARKVVGLSVSGAFHTPLMQAASDRFDERLERAGLSEATVPVIQDATAEPATEPGDILAALEKQMTGPVLWEACLRRMAELGVEGIVEVGPGTVLKGLAKRTLPDMLVWSVDDERDRDELIEMGKSVA
jgi:[acyl-carrier-protein] S-malonyltransferase